MKKKHARFLLAVKVCVLSLCLLSCTDGEDIQRMLLSQSSLVRLTTSPSLNESNEINLTYGDSFLFTLILKKDSHENSLGFETLVKDEEKNVLLYPNDYSLVQGHPSEVSGMQYVYSDETNDCWVCTISFDNLSEGKHIFTIECIPWWCSPMNGVFSSASPHPQFELSVIVTK